MSEFDTDTLLEAIRDRGGLPASDSRYSGTVLLALGTTEMRDYITPMLHQARAEHGIYPYSAAVTAGLATYRMPARAMGGSLRDVVWTPAGGTTPVHLAPKPSSDPWVVATGTKQGPPTAYYVRNYSVVLVPSPDQAGTLSLPYYARPNRLVDVDTCAVISGVVAIPGSGGLGYTVFCVDNPVNSALTNSLELEVVRGTPGFETLTENGLPTNPDDQGATVSVDLTISTTPAVGDYLVTPGVSPVPQLPVEMYGLLAARVALIAVEGTGDNAGTLVGLRRQCAELEARAQQWLSPRVESGNMAAGGSLSANPMLGVTGGGWAMR